MDVFHRIVASIAKDFPPRSHGIDRIEINGRQAVLHIVPKPGFSGEPKTFLLPVSEDWDTVFLALGNHHFFQQLFEPIPDTRS